MATSGAGNAYPLVVTLLHRGKFLIRFSAILILKLDLASSGGRWIELAYKTPSMLVSLYTKILSCINQKSPDADLAGELLYVCSQPKVLPAELLIPDY